MKIKNSIKIEKYNKYKQLENNIYSIDDNYYITLYCELKDNEDTQYPLEDLLDKYNVACTGYFENCLINSKHVYIFELEGNFENIKEVSLLIGREFYE